MFPAWRRAGRCPSRSRRGRHSHLWQSNKAPVCAMTLADTYTPAHPLFAAQTTPSHPSIPELCDDFISEDCPPSNLHPTPEEITGGTAAITAGSVCLELRAQAHVRACELCSPLSACTAPLWCHGTKKAPFFFFCLCFTGTINVPWPRQAPFCSHFPSFSPSSSPTLSEVSSLYWMVQKQNHKPISVTLAMRLDGPNLSPFGAIGSTPVSLKRPLSSTQRGSFLFGDNCN